MSKKENKSKNIENPEELSGEDIYEKIIKDNKEIKDAYRYGIMTAIFNSILFVIAASFLIFSLNYKTPTQYIHADEYGSIMKDVPLNEWGENYEVTGQWLADSLKEIFSYNFTNLETHPSRVKKYFSINGFKNFKDQYERSTTKAFVKENKAVAFAGRIAAPTLLDDIVTGDGLGIRKYETRMNQIIQGYEGKKIESYKVTVIIIRKEIKDFKEGKAIGSIIVERANDKN